MLFGGNLGLCCLSLVVVLFVPVIVFVVRRKWRLAAARREEIKRLLVLASEEAASAELEATTGYGASVASYSQQFQYQCAVCFCPTTTRCARCKAVRYCTGKCQIIHWRQGHKEECRPFTATHKSNEMGSTSSQNAFEQEEYDSYGDNFEAEGRFAQPVEPFVEEYTFSNSSSPRVRHRKGDIAVERISDGKTNPMSKSTSCSTFEGFSASSTCSESSIDASVSNSTDSDGSDGFQSIDVTEFETDRANVNQDRPSFSEHPIPVDTTDSFTKSFKLDQIKIGSTDRGGQRILSSSSSSTESSFSVPSTSSSGFWEGTIDYRKLRTDALHNSAKFPSSDRRDSNMSNPRSSLSSDSLGNTRPPMDLRAPYSKTVALDNAGSTTYGIKKSIDEAAISEESSTEDLKPRKSGIRSSIMSEHIDVDPSKNSPITKSTDLKPFSSSASADPASTDRGLSVGKDAKKVSSLLPSKSERSNHVVNDTSSTSHSPKSQEVGSVSSMTSDVQLLSSSGRNSARFPKPVKADDDKAKVFSCSSESAVRSQNVRNGLKTSMSKVVDHLKASKLSRRYPSEAGSEIAARHNKKVLFPYELFVKLYNWKEVELRPCGLINVGNSCYANAVLQCLAFTPPLTAYLLQGLHSKACEKKEWCFTCEFESLVLKSKAGNSPLSPIRILSQIQNIGSRLANGRQEDAHEFLRYAIDTMQSVCLKEAGAKASDTLEEETTLIGLTFGGYLRSKIQCLKCGGKSERHERMMDLTVEIDGDIGTLEEALRQFTGTEILDGENKYQCSRCKSYERAKKKLTVLEAPNVLTIALKRFQSGKFGKINKSIRFPEILDLAPYMSGTSYKSSVYRLYGVVVHLDIMNAAFSGHYVCYVRNIQNKWFKIDDSTVKAVELERVLAKGAYMLLYARCSPRAPRSITTNSTVPRDPSKPENPTIKSRRPTGPRDVSITDHANARTGIESLYPDHPSFQPIRTSSEEDCSSDNSSSIFSEASSCSTESSNRDSSSTEDYFDQIFGDLGRNWNSSSSPWRNSPDSETSSSSASSPSPLYSRHSSGNKVVENNGPFLCCDESEHSRKVGVSSISSSKCSCRETDKDRLGRGVNPLDGTKSGVLFRRSSRERTV